jgi:hypothetical protein
MASGDFEVRGPVSGRFVLGIYTEFTRFRAGIAVWIEVATQRAPAGSP